MRAKSIALAALGLLTLAAGRDVLPAWAYGPGDPRDAEASFDGARLRDDLAGTIADPAKEVRITFRALSQVVKGKISATLTADKRSKDPGATGLGLWLCDAEGNDLGVAGSRYDVSKAGKSIRWNGFPLPATGAYTLVIRAETPGTWRLVLAGKHGKATAEDTSPGIAPGATDDVEFDGLAGATAAWTLDRVGKGAKFVGEAVSVVQPDQQPLDGIPAAATGKVTLVQDGRHDFVYRNAGTAANDGAHVRIDVTGPKLVKRIGYVTPGGTAFVPVVRKVDPASAYHKEAALPVILTGRDFQEGADVRLVRNGRPDILASDVEVMSETQIRCVLDLDTTDTEGKTSVGTWKVGVWNAPVYGAPDDRTTLVQDSRTRSVSRSFRSLSAAAIQLPSGIVKGTEVWFVDFNDAFQGDLDKMGLGSSDPTTRELARNAVEAYTIVFLRDLFRANETNGALVKNTSVPISFIVGRPGAVSGLPGTDYNRIEVGGAFQAGDLHDVAEPLYWGYADIDTGNAAREDLSVLDGQDVRVGAGARTAVLDPAAGTAASGWTTAMQPLRTRPLTANDRRFFQPGFFPADQSQADRYKDVVLQFTRAAREIAAVIAHHVGKAMGVEDGVPVGPMSNPTLAGDLWPTTTSLRFSDNEIATMRANAHPSALPGTTRNLTVTFFPLVTTHTYLLEECTTDSAYGAPSQGRFGLVGGRPNAPTTDYRVQYVVGSVVPRGLTLSFDGLDGKAPLWLDQASNQFYFARAIFRIAVTDKVRNTVKFFQYRLNIVPDVAKLPAQLQQAATNARDAVRAP